MLDGKRLITKAFGNMQNLIADREKNADDRILTNLSRAGSSCEDWYKFELVSQINNLLERDSLCAAEWESFDILVKSDTNRLIAAELKHVDNWNVTAKHFTEFKKDNDKLKGKDGISAKYAILVTRFAIPVKFEKWMLVQFESNNSFKNESEFYSKMEGLLQHQRIENWTRLPEVIFSNEFFSELKLGCYLVEVL